MKYPHFSKLIHQQSENFSHKIAYNYKDSNSNSWKSTTWKQFSEYVLNASKAFAQIGLVEHKNVGIFSQNMPEFLIAEFGLFANRAVSVPIYATSSQAQVEYILKDAEISTLLVGEQEQYDIAFSLLENNSFLKTIILFDHNIKLNPTDSTSLFFDEFLKIGEIADNTTTIQHRTECALEEDLACLMYTSGTTGESKGVMITHANFLESMRIHDLRLTIAESERSVSFLPLTHIFEKSWSYFCLCKGIIIDLNLRPTEIQKTLKEVRPTMFCSVPRFWEKVYAGIQEKMAEVSLPSRLLMKQAIFVGRKRNLDYVRNDIKVPFILESAYLLFDKLVFQKIKKTIGIENGNFFPVAGAPLSDSINEFLQACGINIIYGYGLTETTATVSCYPKKRYKIGTVGSVMPDIEIKIGDGGEIMVKGKTVMKGYYNKPEETAQVLDAEGWFKTGDAGSLNRNGDLIMTERIKDLIKTSNGKYVAPQALEIKISEDKYIEQIAVIGDQRKYITALIIPAYEALKEYAVAKQIQYQNIEDLIKNGLITEMFFERINELQKNFAKFEQIKRFTLLPYPFTLEGGELTNTLKLKRKFILQQYSAIIEEMYQ